MAKENKNYKDSVFTDLFYSDRDAKSNLLSLYNALHGTCYTDPEIIRKIRLEDVIFKNSHTGFYHLLYRKRGLSTGTDTAAVRRFRRAGRVSIP